MTTSQFTLAEASQYIATAQNLIEQACNKDGKSLVGKLERADEFSSFQRLRDSFTEAKTQVKQTNLNYLTPRQSRKLRKIYSKRLQRAAVKAAYKILAKKDYYNAYYLIRHNLPTDTLSKIQAKHAALEAKVELAKITGKTVKYQLPAALSPAPVKLTWPNLDTVNYRVDRAVKDLHKSWDRAINTTGLTGEEQFLLQRIVTDYLPDTWRMYHTISDMPDRVTRKASEMVLSQLDVLQGRVNEILNIQRAGALKALRAQTSFINGKKTTQAGNRLLRIP